MAELVDQNYPDTFVCELARIDRLGPNRRLIFTVPSVDGDQYSNIVAKLIVPAQYLPALIQLLACEAYAAPEGRATPELLALDTAIAN